MKKLLLALAACVTVIAVVGLIPGKKEKVQVAI
jgi:hypothetical protein